LSAIVCHTPPRNRQPVGFGADPHRAVSLRRSAIAQLASVIGAPGPERAVALDSQRAVMFRRYLAENQILRRGACGCHCHDAQEKREKIHAEWAG